VTTSRPYQEARSSEGALEVLRGEVRRGGRRSEIVEAFAGFILSRA